MDASSSRRKLRWLLVAWGLHGSAHAEPRTHAELTCVLDSGDLLGNGSGSAREEPPWQGVASSRRGDESRVRLALAAAEPGFLLGMTTSALLRVELGLNEPALASASGLRDLSSSIAVSGRLLARTELTLRAFPFDTDYLRLGYLHALDWGGTDGARGESIFLQPAGAAPGLELSLRAPRVRLFSALKWANVDDALRGRRRLWGVLSGGSADLADALRVEGGFGFFQRPSGALGAGAAPSLVEGASLRVVWHRGVHEPELSAEPFTPPPLSEETTLSAAPIGPGLALALEGVTLVQRLRRFESPGAASLQPAPAAALYGSARGRIWAGHAALTWRSLAFVQRNDLRSSTGESLPEGALERAELAAWLGGSAMVRQLSLVPSLELGLRLPAAIEMPSVLPGFGQSLLAIEGAPGLQALPVGAGRLPVVAARLGARFQASASVALAFFGEYQRNPNRVVFAPSSSGVTRSFAPADRLALEAAARARF